MNEEKMLRGAFGPGPDCLPVEVLESHLALAAHVPERRGAEDHLSGCAHCRTELALATEFRSGAVKDDEADAVRWIESRLHSGARPSQQETEERWWHRLWNRQVVGSLAAAVAVLALAVGLSTHRRTDEPIPDFGKEATRSGKIEATGGPNGLSFTTIPGAERYELTAREVDGSVIFHNSFIFDNSFTKRTLAWPPEVVRSIAEGRLVLWELVATNADGTEMGRSGVNRLQPVGAKTR